MSGDSVKPPWCIRGALFLIRDHILTPLRRDHVPRAVIDGITPTENSFRLVGGCVAGHLFAWQAKSAAVPLVNVVYACQAGSWPVGLTAGLPAERLACRRGPWPAAGRRGGVVRWPARPAGCAAGGCVAHTRHTRQACIRRTRRPLCEFCHVARPGVPALLGETLKVD